jgi:hypothetical protein
MSLLTLSRGRPAPVPARLSCTTSTRCRLRFSASHLKHTKVGLTPPQPLGSPLANRTGYCWLHNTAEFAARMPCMLVRAGTSRRRLKMCNRLLQPSYWQHCNGHVSRAAPAVVRCALGAQEVHVDWQLLPLPVRPVFCLPHHRPLRTSQATRLATLAACYTAILHCLRDTAAATL